MPHAGANAIFDQDQVIEFVSSTGVGHKKKGIKIMLKEIPNTWFDEQRITIQLYKSKVPARMHAGIIQYILFGTRPGGFFRAVLANDLMESARRADPDNRKSLPAFAHFLHNYTYIEMYGSLEKMKHWMEIGGLHGLQRKVKEKMEEEEMEEEKDV